MLFALLAASPLMADIFYVTPKTNGQIGDLKYKKEDILLFDTERGEHGEWSIFFDGSDVGLVGQQIDGFYVAEDYLLLSFLGNLKLSINGQKVRVQGADIVKFNWDPEGGGGRRAAHQRYFRFILRRLRRGSENQYRCVSLK
ncbi:hypothetical protein [Methylomicrobium agile]|uniref:hypothetical protein n=1 Tax=Methylomicrobium agile TaxID=39774 RepID=UPI0012F6F036|nr:hypothetical protein [Methylomicrobium agile]